VDGVSDQLGFFDQFPPAERLGIREGQPRGGPQALVLRLIKRGMSKEYAEAAAALAMELERMAVESNNNGGNGRRREE
jgi:hypothetical protein